ncbi:MAG: D-alanyl-D-alanine carboxypeptidase [Oscillospiraceae bacterium]|nr:D-alanyl-D-alanine carboxypeptidase [Oscillospiraceae bacterium]
MKKSITCFLAAILLVTALTLPARSEELRVGAKGAVVIEAGTGRILFGQDEHERLPMASTTKIMTALLALEQEGVDLAFTVDPDAIRVEGSSMGLQEGDTVTLEALAIGMLLHSGNDAANAAAVRISGCADAFADEMNRRAAGIGMRNTSFETPSGLDGEHHYSTAYDMALLAREAVSNQRFAAICSQYKLRANFGNPPYPRWLKNHNKLLSYYDGAFGVKTGFTKKAGRCLVSAARRDGVELICVTLSCSDDWTVHQNLYDHFFARLTATDLAAQMPAVTLPVVGGAQSHVAAIPDGEAVAALPNDGGQVRYALYLPEFLYPPVSQGQYLGQADVYLDEQIIASLSLIAEQDVPLPPDFEETKGIFERVTDFIDHRF